MAQHALTQQAWVEVEHGVLTAPDGRRLVRGGTRLGRADADEAVRAGAPVVVHWPGGGELDWFDGADAVAAWQQRRALFTSASPAPTRKRMAWTGGLWSDDAGSVLVLTGHC